MKNKYFQSGRWSKFDCVRLRKFAAGLALQLFIAPSALADGFMDALRNMDLNNYALGGFLYSSSSYYEGIDNALVVFPAPTTFGSAISSDDTFFIRDGDFGIRAQFASGWDFGVLASIQTLGYGSGQSLALAGMSRRDWTIQAGATVGRDLWGFRIDAVAETDILDVHNGQEYTFKFARLFDRGNHYFLPQLEVLYQSSDLVDYYFGVTPSEALPGRPAYQPGAAVTYSGSVEWSWQWHRNWFVTARGSVDRVPDEIRMSPIVDSDYSWSVSLGIGYDAPSMVAMQSDRPGTFGLGLEVSLGAFFVQSDSKVFIISGSTATPVNLETDFNLDDTDVVIPLNFIWRLNSFHRLEFGYFQLKRNGAGDIVVPIDIGEVTFLPGDTVQTSFDTTIYKLGYAFSLMHDAQKELTIFGGAHITDISYQSTGDVDTVNAETTAILPVLGADLTVNFTERLSLEVELQFFIGDVNHYSGSLIDFGFAGNYRWHDRLDVGAGYRLYRQDIDSADESLFGDYNFEYRGPFVYARARF